MIKINRSILPLSLFLAYSASVSSNMLTKDALLAMSAESVQATCKSDSFLSCANISENKCLEISTTVRNECLMTLPDEFEMNEAMMASLDSCVEKLSQKVDIDLERLDACEELDVSQQGVPNQAEQMAEFGKMIQTATATGSHLDEVTLPLYEPHEVTVHNTKEAVMNGVKFLPVISLKVKASEEEIIAFYKQQLPNFKIDPDDPYLLVEKLVPNSKDMYKYAYIPRIELFRFEKESVLVHVYYRP